jgi:phage-related protein
MSNSIGYAVLPIVPSVKGIGSGVASQISGPLVSASGKAGTDAGNSLKGGILGIAKSIAAPLLAYMGFRAIKDGFKAAIGNASDLNEAGTAVQQIFGTSFPAIQTWAEGAATAMGQSTVAALNAAKTFGVYGSSAGLAGDANVKFSTGLAELAGDLASFHNTSPEQAIEAIGGALRGETEPIRAYGILLDDASIRQKALAMGIVSTTKNALTPQQRVLAVQALIFDQAGAATGDFARTQAGLANQQRIMSAQLTNISAQFGSLFLPAVAAGAGVLSSVLLPALSRSVGFLTDTAVPALQYLFGYLTGKGADVELPPALTSGLETFAQTLQVIWGAVSPIFSAIAGGFGIIWQAIAPLVPSLLAAASSASPFMLILRAITPILPQITSLITQLATIIGGALAAILPQVVSLLTSLGGAVGTLIASLLPPLMSFIMMLVPIFASLIGVVVQLVQILVPILVPIITQLASILGGILAAVLPIIAGLISALAPVFIQLVQAMLPVIAAVLGLIGPILDLVMPLIDLLLPVLSPIIDLLVMLITKSLEPLMIAFKLLLPPILAVITTIVQSLMPVIGAITQILGGLINFLVGVFTGNWKQAWGGIVDIFTGIWNGITAVVKGVLNIAIDLINGIITGINFVTKGIKEATGGAINLTIGKIPHLALGADVAARRGGTLALLGEAGQAETVTNLGSTNRAIDAATTLAEKALAGDMGIDVEELARAIIEALGDGPPTDLSSDTIDRLARALAALLRSQSRQGSDVSG